LADPERRAAPGANGARGGRRRDGGGPLAPWAPRGLRRAPRAARGRAPAPPGARRARPRSGWARSPRSPREVYAGLPAGQLAAIEPLWRTAGTAPSGPLRAPTGGLGAGAGRVGAGRGQV